MARSDAFTQLQATQTRYISRGIFFGQNILFFLFFTGFYRSRKLGISFPRLYDIVEGEAMAGALLQLNPDDRIGAEDGLSHPYFAPLPKKLYELPDG